MLSSYLSAKFHALQRNENFERETYCVYNFCLSLQLLTKKVTIYSKLSFQLTPPSIYFVAQYYNFKRPFSVLLLSSASWRTLVQKACLTLYIYAVVSENHKWFFKCFSKDCCLDLGRMIKTEIQISFSWATN